MDAAVDIADLKRRLAQAETALRDRAAVEAALRDSEEKCRAIFDSIDEGFCVVEVIGGEKGAPIDYRFLETNAAFERQTGLVDAVGRRMRDMEPRHEEHWFERYARIARTRTPERFEDRADALGRWYDVYAFPVGRPEQRRVAILFRDVVDRKRAEQALVKSNALLRTTFDSSLQIVQLFKAVRNARNEIVDFEWLLTNKQWDDRWGPRAGKSLLEENPAVAESGIWDKFLKVIESGTPITHKHHYAHEQFDGWFLQTIARADDGILLSTLDITESKRTEIALRESEERYRTLFETMDDGFVVGELIRNDDGQAIDFRYLELNAVVERLVGWKPEETVGRLMSDVIPSEEAACWVRDFETIIASGSSSQFEHFHTSLGQWFRANATPVGGDRIAVVYQDVTAQKRAEQALRDSEERQAFLLALGDAMRAEPAADGKIAVAGRLLGEKLSASRVLYAEWDDEKGLAHIFNGWLADGAQPFPPVLKLENFEGDVLNDLLEGRVVRLDDIGRLGAESGYAAIANVGVQALLSAPLLVDGELKFNVSIHQHEPRHWRDDEVALVQEVSERLWAEIVRARAEEALVASEAKYRLLFETMSQGYGEVELLRDEHGRATDVLYLLLNPAFERFFGIPAADAVGRTAREVLVGIEDYWFEIYDRVSHSGQPDRIELELGPSGGCYALEIHPRGGDRLLILYDDITERKHAEAVLRESEERQAYLLRLSDALRPLTDAGEIIGAATRLLGEGLGASRAYYAEWPPGTDYVEIGSDYSAPGLPSLVGRYPIEFFRSTDERFREGRTWVIQDAADGTIPAAERDYCLEHGVAAWVDVPLVKGGKLQAALFLVQDAPRCWTATEIALAEETAERTWAALDRARAEAALRDSEARFQQFGRASSDGMWIRDAATLALEYASDAMEVIYGISREEMATDPMAWPALIVPEDRDETFGYIEKVKAGESVVHEFRIQRPSDLQFRWIRSVGFPLLNNGNDITRIAGISSDITEEKQLAEHQSVLLAELQHRVRNIMAIIRSIVARTAKGAADTADYVELLSGRLLTLARVQALLTRAANAGVGMFAIVHDELAAQATHAEQFDVAGPDVVLSPKAAETMTLAIHELTTNALKYGALSSADGKVEVRWEIVEKQGTPWLRFDWIETGAPVADASTGSRRTGFGSELIEGRVPYELGGRGALTIEPGGARCHLEFPLKDGASVLETDAPKRATLFGGAIDMSGHADLTGQTVLVVEDDYYLATDTARALKGAGAEVIGPCATEAGARDELARTRPTCAVLDIDLRGSRSFDLARELKREKVPFVFITGYDQEVIPDDLADVMRLQKPVRFTEIVGALAQMLGVDHA